MATTPEGKVKKKVVDLLKAHDVYYFFVPQNGMGRSGVPDIVGCIRGYFIAIEVKAGKNTTTALQEREIDAIRKHKGVAVVVNEEKLTMLDDLLKELNRE
jgi:Holliday junction resolvase